MGRAGSLRQRNCIEGRLRQKVVAILPRVICSCFILWTTSNDLLLCSRDAPAHVRADVSSAGITPSYLSGVRSLTRQLDWLGLTCLVRFAFPPFAVPFPDRRHVSAPLPCGTFSAQPPKTPQRIPRARRNDRHPLCKTHKGDARIEQQARSIFSIAVTMFKKRLTCGEGEARASPEIGVLPLTMFSPAYLALIKGQVHLPTQVRSLCSRLSVPTRVD